MNLAGLHHRLDQSVQRRGVGEDRTFKFQAFACGPNRHAVIADGPADDDHIAGLCVGD